MTEVREISRTFLTLKRGACSVSSMRTPDFHPATITDASGRHTLSWVEPLRFTYTGDLGHQDLTFSTEAEASAFFLAFATK